MNERKLKRRVNRPVDETFSIRGTFKIDNLVKDVPLDEYYTDYSVEMCAKRNELEYVSVPTITDPQEVQNACSDLNNKNVNP